MATEGAPKDLKELEELVGEYHARCPRDLIALNETGADSISNVNAMLLA